LGVSVNEGDFTSGPPPVPNEPRYRVRVNDVLQGIGVAAFVALIGIISSGFRDNLNALWRQLENHINQDNAQHQQLWDYIHRRK
jgi:hypothetical protein